MKLEAPNDFDLVIIIARFEFLKLVKGKKLYAMIVLGALIPILGISLQNYFDFPEPENVEIYLFGLLGSLFFLQVIVVAFFGSGVLVSEFQGKTGYALFPNPIGRKSIWLGKFLSAEISSFLIISVFYIVISVAAISKYNELPIEIFTSLSLSFFVITGLMCFAFMISSIFRSSSSSLLLMIILFIIIFPMIDQTLISFGETKPWFTPSFSSGIISNVLKNPYPSDLEEGHLPRGPFDFEVYVPYLLESVAIFLVYSLLFGLVSIVFFQKREMA